MRKNIEWLLTEKCNFNCSYCGLYNNKKNPSMCSKELEVFLDFVEEKQDEGFGELFIFGGEPTVHPDFIEIINKINKRDIKYIIQTNLSDKAVRVLLNSNPKKINISVHPEQQSLNKYIKNIRVMLQHNWSQLKSNSIYKSGCNPINNIEIMYVGNISIKFYKVLEELFPELNIILCPVSDFLVEGFGKKLKEYNNLKKFRNDINFEDIEVKGPNGIIKDRSLIWEDFIDQKQSPKGKECLLKDFIMIDSQFNKFNCCFHTVVDKTCCPFDTCFLS